MFTLLSSYRRVWTSIFKDRKSFIVKNGADFVFVPTYEEHPQFAGSILKLNEMQWIDSHSTHSGEGFAYTLASVALSLPFFKATGVPKIEFLGIVLWLDIYSSFTRSG